MEFGQSQAAGEGACSGDKERTSIHLHLGSQGLGGRQGALVVPAGGVAVQAGRALGQRRSDDGPLGETLGRGHGQVLGLDKAEIAVQGLPHLLRGPLTGGRGLFLARAGVSEGSAPFQGFQPGRPARFSHAESHQRTGLGRFVEAHNNVIIGLGSGRGDNLYHFAAKAAGTLQDGKKYLPGRGAFKIVVGTDEHGAVGAAGFPDAPADGSGGLHLQVYILGAGLDGVFQDFRGLAFLGQAAGGDERDVGLAEEQVHFLFLQGAAVQADFGHFQLL